MRTRGAMVGITVAASCLLLSACDWEDFDKETFADHEAIGQPVSEVRFTNDSGDLKITVGDRFEVRRTVGYGDTKPGKTYRMDGDALVLEECEERDCWVDYEVTVPEGTTVSGHLDAGNVEIVGVASANVAAESGNVTVRDVDGQVNASTQSGNIELSGIGGAVVAGAQSGNVRVGLTAADSVTASTESGNVDVTVPDASYQVDISTGSGEDITNEIGDDDTGPALELRAESGNVSLRAS
jgi:hypothetical protein